MAVVDDETLEKTSRHSRHLSTGDDDNLHLDTAEQIHRLLVVGHEKQKQKPIEPANSHHSDLSSLANHTNSMTDMSFSESTGSGTSGESFASFCGSSDSGGNESLTTLNDSNSELVNITTEESQIPLDEVLDPVHRHRLNMNRLADSGLVKAASLRFSSLHLIEEDGED